MREKRNAGHVSQYKSKAAPHPLSHPFFVRSTMFINLISLCLYRRLQLRSSPLLQGAA
jgi:hypothetical protein